MICSYCNATNDSDATFCVTCGKTVLQPTVTTRSTSGTQQNYQSTPHEWVPYAGHINDDYNVPSTIPQPVANGFGPGEVLVLREVDENEGEVKPNQRRPLIVVDETMTHLANTDRQLELSELLNRVRSIIDLQRVPVDVQAVNARWLIDENEVRPRVVASLRNHSFSDMKMVLGVDYIGKWASIKLYVGMEPDRIPPEPAIESWHAPVDGILALVICAFLFLLGVFGSTWSLVFSSLLPLIYGIARLSNSHKMFLAKMAFDKTKHYAEQAIKKFQKQKELTARTFKKDDFSLFCTAMKQVFQVVVDDIVKSGAEVAYVKGGSGGFFQKEEGDHVPRTSDASEAEV